MNWEQLLKRVYWKKLLPNVIEKIEKLNSNNLIQLINQQTSCAVKKMKKTRINSGITIINFYFRFLKILFFKLR